MYSISTMKWRGLRKTLVLVCLFDAILLLWISCSATSDVDGDSDESVLLQFKSSVSDPSGVLSGWDSGSSDHYCSWFGVLCDSKKTRVLGLNLTGGVNGGNSEAFPCSNFVEFPLYGFGIRRSCLDSNGKLVGRLSPVLGKLTELRVLLLPFNDLSGEIPAAIWELPKLEVLDLEGNSLNGTLPVEFGGLNGLRILNLAFNKIVGEIPVSLSKCVGLQMLNLAGNQVEGTIPRFVGWFSELRGLYLSLNRFIGSIPDVFGNNCRNLEHIDLSGNLLQGDIPSSLGNCTRMRSLLLFANLLEDMIPPELGRLQKLEVLDVSRNSLSGPIPPELGKCVELSVLVLSNLYDPLPSSKKARDNSSLEPSSAANNDDYNYFQGTIPVEILKLPKLRIIWVPRATLEGKFPSDWGSCNSLEMINLAQNFFTGEIPEVFGRCKNLHFLDLSINRLCGALNEKLPVPCMNVFDVGGNFLSGSIPRFNNSICAPVPSSNGYLAEAYSPFSAYRSFFMFKTQTGRPLPSFGIGGSVAIYHNFGENNFSGSFPLLPIAPERLGKEIDYAFLAGGNRLTGLFPGHIFGKCSGLNGIFANISNNKLSGEIPSEIGTTCRSLKFLNASRNWITGSMPQSFGDLGFLVSLDLNWNALQGNIPQSLGQLKDLKYLSLAGNNLTGFIPSSLGQLHSLGVLELSSNSLSGEIPEELVNLRNLSALLLNNNNLSGQIPYRLVNLTSLSAFNLSFNNLSGPLPSVDNLRKCSSFLGNPFLQPCRFTPNVPSSDNETNGDSLNSSATPVGSNTRKSGNNGFSSIEIASITSATAIVSVLLALIILFWYTRKCTPKSRVRVSGRREVTVFTDIGVPLTFENVVRATGSFNASNCIGSGGFGATYKAEISPGVLVAIKRLSVGRFQGVQQFHAEIKTLGRMRHQNLVTLIGYHASETEMFLIYNYLPGGNLERFIQERSTRAVDWRVLHKIALDIARALAYLHDQCVPRVLHRDVKPSNILLDNDFNAYLSDFGLARLLGTSETHATTGVAGTFGYVAPEYAMTCRVSDKADVYSYGVVLLELISDKKVLDPSFSSFGNGFSIVAWACMLLRQGRAKEFFTAGLWEVGPHDDLIETLHLGVMCTVETLSVRPTMKLVVQKLKHLQPAPC